MTCCIVLHNMIIEDERDSGPQGYTYDLMGEPVHVSHEHTPDLQQFIQNHHRIRDRDSHRRLQADLVEHIWSLQGDAE